MTAAMARFAAAQGVDPSDYAALWQWSVDDLDRFWTAVWAWFDPPADGDATPALAEDRMPGAVWFPGVRLNYAEVALRLPGRADDDVVVLARSQTRADVALTAAELRDHVARARSGLLRAGVRPGDHVAAYAPNIPETLVLMLAAASIGAVFSSCAPEFGPRSVVDRLSQTRPVLLLTIDGYTYGDRSVDRRDAVATILAGLPSLRHVVHLGYADPASPPPAAGPGVASTRWADLLAGPGDPTIDRLAFDHPLYVLYSSGTTGLPKPIVHGHGGIALEHLKALGLHLDLGPTDRFCWFSTTGWMMWNLAVSGLAVGSTVVLLDGDPAHPDPGALWRTAGDLGVTYLGTSAPFVMACRKAGVVPRQEADLSTLRGLGVTGAPLPVEGFDWAAEAVGPDVPVGSMSGGTDVCTAFVGGSPTVPVRAGRLSCRQLGCAVEAWDADGHPVVGSLGELVVTRPMPSMPRGFVGDPDGTRYRAAYFETWPGVWRHGDWIAIDPDGSCVISGRSDATLNRGGVRLGTAELYAVVESLPEIADSLVVHLEDAEGPGRLLLFVVLAAGVDLTDDLVGRVRSALRTELSPRHVPDEVHAVSTLPRTLSGKKVEVPVKRILLGTPPDRAVSAGSLADPRALDVFTPFAPPVAPDDQGHL